MPSFAGLTICLLAAFPQQEKSIFEQVCPNPTGRNGYEEYLKACDLFRSQVGDQVWEESQMVRAGDLGWLNTHRAVSNKASQAIETVRAGNDKPVSDPRTGYRLTTTVPELVYFKNLTRVMVVRATVQFADGQPRDAVRTLDGALRFSSGVQETGVLINFLVGIAMQSIVLRGYNDNLSRLPLPDLERLARSPIGKDDSTAARSCLQREATSIQTMFDELARDRTKTEDFLANDPADDSETSNGIKRLKSLPDSEFVAAVQAAKAGTLARIKRIDAILGSPEPRWSGLISQFESGEANDKSPVGILSESFALGSQILAAELKRRMQLRLFRVHVLVRRHRLMANKLPDTLDQLGDQNLTVDPLTGKPFVYEVSGDTYQLYSRGTEQTGRIDLVWKKDAKSGSVDDEVIKP
ncbi:MAG: hypothetical protein JST30_07375 [Armatimonadetes bacterium]|nr:hypothetical protein [Armatimonadota bacterium]